MSGRIIIGTFSVPTTILLIMIVIVTVIVVVDGQKDLGDVLQGCPEGTYRHENHCYMVSSNFVTYEDAETICKAGRGLLAPVKSSQTEEFLQKLRIRKFLHRYWFGLDDKRTEGEWMHGDGTRLSGSFTRWTRGEPNNLAKSQHCAYMWLERHLEWDDEDCARKFLYACQFNDANCTDGLPSYGRYCYELSHDIATYDEADLECHERGGILANIKTESVFNFIKSIIYADRFWVNMSAKQMQYMLREQSNKASWILDTWIGVWHTNGEWFTSDGTVVNYTNWAPGEPYSIRDKEDCVKLGQSWHDVQCDLRHGFICRYQPAGGDNESITQLSKNVDCAKEIPEPTSKELESRSVTSAMRHETDDPGNRKSNQSGINLGIAELSYTITGCIMLGMLIATLMFITINWHSQRNARSRRILQEDLQDLEVLCEHKNDDLP